MSVIRILISFVLVSSAFPALAGTFYISTSSTASNSNLGTSASPWKTFAYAISKLQPGDTLVLKSGTYGASNSGYLHVDCAAGAKNGSSTTAVITVKAEVERQAFIKSPGNVNPVNLQNCSYWKLDGLRIEAGDYEFATSFSATVRLKGSHITARRLLVRFNNRYVNSSLFSMNLTDSLIEENEIYSYHRHGFYVGTGSGRITFRRNYANSRNHADIARGFASPSTSAAKMGDSGFTIYATGTVDDVVYENNISEGNEGGFRLNGAYGIVQDTRLRGNISLRDTWGFFESSSQYDPYDMPLNNHLENHVAIDSHHFGFYSMSARGTVCDGCTAINAGLANFMVEDKATNPGDGNYSYAGFNLLSLNSPGKGIKVTSGIDVWSIKTANAYNNGLNYDPGSSSRYTNIKSIDPNLGACKVWVPDSSPMRKTGVNGDDIGARVLYRYQDGVLTSIPLWNPSSGEFPRGAKITGVNDVAGSSLFDVHNRLGVNVAGCAFPLGYGSGSTPPPPPETPEDSTAPTIAFSKPAAGGIFTVEKPETLTATASDAVGVTKVEFFDGSIKIGDGVYSSTSNSWSIVWNLTAAVQNGPHSLIAKAHDAAGNVGTASVAVSVDLDRTLPVVSFSQPVVGYTYTTATTKTLIVSAADNRGVTKVEFYDGATKISDGIYSSTANSWSGTWNVTSALNGAHSLIAKAYDAAGNVGTALVAINVAVHVRKLIPQSQMSIYWASVNLAQAPNVLDGNTETRWYVTGGFPKSITMRLGGTYNVTGLQYKETWTRIGNYEIYVSTSATSGWVLASSGVMPATGEISFPGKTGSYLKLVVKSAAGDRSYCYASEISVWQTGP